MKKTSPRRKKQKSTPIFPIVLLIIALIGIAVYIAVHFSEANTRGSFVDRNPSSPAYTEKAETPAPTMQPDFAPEPTPATPSEATASEATIMEPVLVIPPTEEDKPLLQVYFMSVGRNDAILIRMGDECAFIDGGRESSAQSAVRYISEELGIKKLKYYIATHGHDDHVGCAGLVLSTFETETILYNSDLSMRIMMQSAKNDEIRKVIEDTNKQLFYLNDVVTIGDAVLTCVGPEIVVPRKDGNDGTENENSIIIRLTYGNRSFLLTGDATTKNFQEMLEFHPEAAVCDVIKGAHHDNPINKEFLIATQAKYYVYSTGSDFLPPNWDINKVRETGARVFITSKNSAGSTLFTTDGEFLKVETENTARNWKLDRTTLKMRAGKNIRCTYTLGKDAVDTLHWTTSDDSIVRIEYDFGRVKIYTLAPGKCTITATNFDGSTREIAVEVRK